MLSRRPWIAAFIGHALRRGRAADPDWAFDTADELHPTWRKCDPEFAADSAFGPQVDGAGRQSQMSGSVTIFGMPMSGGGASSSTLMSAASSTVPSTDSSAQPRHDLGLWRI